LEALDAANNGGAALDGFFKGCVLTWLDTGVSKFRILVLVRFGVVVVQSVNGNGLSLSLFA
jgi:hypothetical protein